MTNPSKLNDRDAEALAYFWAIHWAALVLNPQGLQTLRSTMANLGLVEKRGPLAMSRAGQRVMAFVKAADRPKYPARRKARKSTTNRRQS